MAGYFEKRGWFNEEREKYYRQKQNVWLKYAALGSIAVSIVLIIVAAVFIDSISIKALLFLRGCAGFFAVIFVALVAILVYRVNVAFFNDKANNGNSK